MKFAKVYKNGKRFLEVTKSLYIAYPDENLRNVISILEDLDYQDERCLVLLTEIDALVDALLTMKGEIRKEEGTYDLGAV